MLSKLALGTAQFGLEYGIANQTGKVGVNAARAILELACSHGLRTLDTAIAYGDSEQTLGRIGISDWQVITKLPAVPEGCPAVGNWVQTQLGASLQRLETTHVYGLLLHRPQQLSGPFGPELLRALQHAKASGRVQKIGVSVYDPAELDAIFKVHRIDLVQAPFNVLDKRLLTSGWLARLRDQGVEVHTRSAFMQGLLLMPPARRPARFDAWRELWSTWDEWLQRRGISPLAACLRYALGTDGADKVIVGVESVAQLKEILEAARQQDHVALPVNIDSTDVELLNPSHW